jgi:Uma2 family endonuclease
MESKMEYSVSGNEKQTIRENADCVREAQAAYAVEHQGYTLDDYYALPDDQRVELIDGVFYDMAAPTVAHQMVGAEIWNQIAAYIKSQKGKCLPLVSPVDVQLDQDDRTMVQPDVIVVCNWDIIRNRCIFGAPDFVAEVLSDSTARKDMVLKLDKYQKAGVKEYWIVDLKQKRVLVYDFLHEKQVVIYGIDAKIPVRIFEEQCVVDFAIIYEQITFLLNEQEKE